VSKRTPYKPKPEERREVKVEVPKAALADAAQSSWADLLAMAEAAGWRIETSDSYAWCKPDHALLREGLDEMRGIPVLHYQRW
jgi:hypothetical protein